MCVCVYIYPTSSLSECLGCFYVLAIVNSAAVNTGLHASFWIRVFIFSGYMHRSEITGSCDSSVFSFLNNLQTVCLPWLHQLTFLLTVWKGLLFSAPSVAITYRLFNDGHSDLCVVIYFTVVLVCFSLIITNDKHLFMCLLAIWMSSLKKRLFRSSAHFSN